MLVVVSMRTIAEASGLSGDEEIRAAFLPAEVRDGRRYRDWVRVEIGGSDMGRVSFSGDPDAVMAVLARAWAVCDRTVSRALMKQESV